MTPTATSPVAKVVWKDEGDFGFITILTEADYGTEPPNGLGLPARPVGRPYDPNRPRPAGTLAQAAAIAREHGVELVVV